MIPYKKENQEITTGFANNLHLKQPVCVKFNPIPPFPTHTLAHGIYSAVGNFK